MILDVKTFVLGDNKGQATKVLEEAAEVFGAWQSYDSFFEGDGCASDKWFEEDLADEIADVITAACNLAFRYRIDMAKAMERCAARNMERGRL